MSVSAPTVFVVDDDPSIRKALGRLLKADGFQVQKFQSAEEFLELHPVGTPACLVLDVSMPGLNGLDLQQQLADRNSALPIVFITGHGDIPMSVRAMKAGATDFLVKPFKSSDLLKAVRQAVERYAESLRADAEVQEIRKRFQSLSPREREVMTYVVSGRLNKQVGHRLGIAEKTIKVHRARIMHKMGADSLAALVRMAHRLGIEEPTL